MMNYGFYIYSAWGLSAVTLLATVGIIWFESRRLRRELKRLEAQGIRRRSSEPVAGEKS
jgi:heme exporter protein D